MVDARQRVYLLTELLFKPRPVLPVEQTFSQQLNDYWRIVQPLVVRKENNADPAVPDLLFDQIPLAEHRARMERERPGQGLFRRKLSCRVWGITVEGLSLK